MKINKKLLPIKAHYFFFMAAMGPILPQLPVFGKQLGISTVVMGTVTGILPFAFLISKPLFGLLVDVYRNHRKTIFIFLITVMTMAFGLIAFIPSKDIKHIEFRNVTMEDLDHCDYTMTESLQKCNNQTISMQCTPMFCSTNVINEAFLYHSQTEKICFMNSNFTQFTQNQTNFFNNTNSTSNNTESCHLKCVENFEANSSCLYGSFSFWAFIILMGIGSIGFNVVNSISDAICFDVVGEEYDYGKQRVWGTIGFGITALIAGIIVDNFSVENVSYLPAFGVMAIFSLVDILSCTKLKLPIIESPKNILQDCKDLLKNAKVVIFLLFAALSGICDSLIIYFLFWYVEDLADATNTKNIKLIEGIIVAAETLGGEILFFSIAGKILSRLGHVKCLSICFINYALRLGLISVAPNPWWIIPVELVFQGPTYALTYTTIVAYANELAPAGASATMQGIAAGMDDGLGYAIGSILGGFLFKYVGGKNTFQVYSLIALTCSLSHLLIHKVFLKETKDSKNELSGVYLSPEVAAKIVQKS